MKILELKHVSKVYGAGENAVEALRDVSLTVEAGEFTALVGTSGSGKTTLLNMIGGLDVPTEGEVIIRNHNIASLKRRELTIFRRRNLGFVFQNYSLMPVLNVYDNVALPVSFDKGKHIDHDYIKRLLQDLGLWDKRRKYPEELSGGQQQRAGIARAFVSRPEVVFADEPTGNLDTKTTAEIMDMVMGFARRFNQTIILVTHDPGMSRYADRIVTLVDGIITGDERKGQ